MACRGFRGRKVKTGRPFAFFMARTVVYIDGFNLYYRACKPSGHKWLDIAALSAAVLPATAQIIQINYYTARVSGRVDPTAPARQHAYLRALASLPLVKITYGNFRTDKKWSGLVQPPEFRPACTLPPGSAPQVAYVWKTEEKGSDVNLGVHLVRDAYTHAFEEAAILTNDTDLAEAVRIVTQEVGLPVTLLVPSSAPARSLVAVASHVRHIQPYLGPCVFPDPVTLPDGRTVAKPVGW
jgi:uncharacterized LabA/DUF88 family protein